MIHGAVRTVAYMYICIDSLHVIQTYSETCGSVNVANDADDAMCIGVVV